MTAVDHSALRLRGALDVEHITGMELRVGVNRHGRAVVEGEADETALTWLFGPVAGREVTILAAGEGGGERPLFSGVIQDAALVSAGGYHRLRVELASGSVLLDQEARSRSFQDAGQTYSQVAQRVVSGHPGGAAICAVGGERTLRRPVIQYRETDWEFLIRMASHCGGVVVPETSRGLPRIWFGFPERSFPCRFHEDAYTSGVSQRYYELGGAAAGLDKGDFLYYDVKSRQNCDLGWYTVFQGKPFLIMEKHGILDRGEVMFTYRLGGPGLGWNVRRYNRLFSGMTLLGEVLETERETLKLKLDIDEGWDPGGPFPYTWRPETGNFMYCMPQVGTRVSLYFPNWDEQGAMAVNCVRTNGGTCGRMSDPSKRSFVTEHGKELNLYPGELSLVGGTQGLVRLSDEQGIVIQSQKPMVIVGQSVTFEAPEVDILAPAGEVVMVQGQSGGGGGAQASLMISNRYDLLTVAHTQAEGWNQVSYAPFADVPQPGKFDWGGLLKNVLAGLAVVAAVGATLATFGAAGPVVAGALAMGSMAVIGQGMSDVLSGQVSSMEAYMSTGFWSAVAGAVSGGIGSGVTGVLTAKVKVLGPMVINGLGGVVETLAENAVLGVKTELSDLGLAFGLSVVLPGIGDNLARGAKRLVGQMDNLVRGIKGMTGQLDNVLRGASRQADDMLEAAGKQADDLAEDTLDNATDMLRQSDNLLADTGRFVDSTLENNYQEYVKRKLRKGQSPRDRLGWKDASDYWTRESPIARGNNFNKTVRDAELYPYYEINLENGKRLDSYDLEAGEIISRKATDLNRITEDTFRGYLSEFSQKYSTGTKIRSNAYPELDGQVLKGQYILEIPASNADLDNINYFKKIASEYNVILRFTKEVL